MGKTIVWSPEATLDLEGIHKYIARDSVMIAAAFANRLLLDIDRLADFPLLGPRIREWKRSPYRHLVVPPYRVIYRLDDAKNSVFILAIVHGHRDLKRFLQKR